MSTAYFLVSDANDYWYLIPLSREQEWREWDKSEAWHVPDYAIYIDTPKNLIIEDFKLKEFVEGGYRYAKD